MNGKIRACIVAETPLSRLPPFFHEKPQIMQIIVHFFVSFILNQRNNLLPNFQTKRHETTTRSEVCFTNFEVF